MAGFLKTIFSGKQREAKPAISAVSKDADAQVASSVESSSSSAAHLLTTVLPIDPNLDFSAWVIGTNSTIETTLSKVEQQLLAAIKAVIKFDSDNSDLLPRVPAVIPRLLRSLRDENVTSMQIAQEITQDPSFVGEVIRVANSPYYRTAVPTSTLEQALSKLGHEGIRQVIATIAFRSIIDVRSGHFQRIGSPLIWKQTENSAYAARFLAPHEDADIFDAYLATLVQNIGVTVALKILDKHLDIRDVPRSTAFHQAMGLLTQKLTLQIVGSWDFPSSVVKALEEQVNIKSGNYVSPLGSVIFSAYYLSKLFMLVEDKRIQIDLDQIFSDPNSEHQNICMQCYKELTALAQQPA